MNEERQYKPGAMVAFSSGEYSDYRIGSFARVLKPITQEVWTAMREACKDPTKWDANRMDEYKAVPWLVAQGYIEEVEYEELHLGDYGLIPESMP